MTSAQAARIIATLQAGLAHHDAGRLEPALKAYNAVLAADPNNRHALHFTGVALHQAGLNEKARPYLMRAAEQSPPAADVLNHLGVVCQALGDLPAAEDAYRRAIGIDALKSTAMANLLAMLSQSHPEEAFAIATEGLARHPDQNAWRETAASLANEIGRPEEGLALLDDGGPVLAGSANAAFQRSVALRYLDRLAESALWLKRTILLVPGNPNAYANLGVVQQRSGAFGRAVTSHRRALQLRPVDTSISANLGFSLLCAGQLEEGWDVAKARHETPAIKLTREGLPPAWTGGETRTLLVWSEQGLGDEMMFANCLGDLQQRLPDKTVVECEPRLRSLFQRSFPQIRFVDWLPRQPTLDNTSRVDFSGLVSGIGADSAISIGDLCPVLRLQISDFPKTGGYLTSDPDEALAWRSWLEGLGDGPKVGICWRSGAMTALRIRDRLYPEVADLAPVFALPGLTLISLQYDDVTTDLQEMEAIHGHAPVIPPGLDQRNEIDRVAALVAELDLVVSAGTAVNVIAGALGVPTVNFVAHPNWTFLGTGGAPWFPNTKVVVKGIERGWEAAMIEAAEQAQSMLDGKTGL